MRNIITLGLAVALLGLLLVTYAMPAFAQRVGNDATDPAVSPACIAACGGNVSNMPCGGGAAARAAIYRQ